MDEQKHQSLGSQIAKQSKKNKKKERFLRTRMWFSTFISTMFADHEQIPPNIGNNLLISNNMYVTKRHLSAMIVITELSTDVPLAFYSDMLSTVKREVQGITVNMAIRNRKTKFDLKDAGLEGRMRAWEHTLNNPLIPAHRQERAARLLYSVEVLKTGVQAYKSHIYLTVRAAKGSTLQAGINAISNYLNQLDCYYTVIKGDIQKHLEYVSLLSSKRPADIKDIPTNLLTQQTLSEMLSEAQFLNQRKGTLLGIDKVINAPYFENFRDSANAKNIYVTAPSGFGKTFMVVFWLTDMFSDGYNLCLMDIKGNEFSALTKACGGTTVALHQEDTTYVNTFPLDPDAGSDNPKIYFDVQFSKSKRIMEIIASLEPAEQAIGSAIIEKFLRDMYMQLGVEPTNPRTWNRSEKLCPYDVYDMFARFIRTLNENVDIARKIEQRLSIYFYRGGSMSHIFKTPLKYKDILESKVLTFDFGVLKTAEVDETAFKLKVFFMTLLNEEYIAYKKSLGEWTVKVLEEHQFASDYLLQIYKKEVTVRRSQNQITILLGNSISALHDNPIGRPILDNINMLCIGKMTKGSRDYLVNEYGMEDYEDVLVDMTSNSDYDNTFLLVNRFRRNATTALLKAVIPPDIVRGKLFKGVDVE